MSAAQRFKTWVALKWARVKAVWSPWHRPELTKVMGSPKANSHVVNCYVPKDPLMWHQRHYSAWFCDGEEVATGQWVLIKTRTGRVLLAKFRGEDVEAEVDGLTAHAYPSKVEMRTTGIDHLVTDHQEEVQSRALETAVRAAAQRRAQFSGGDKWSS